MSNHHLTAEDLAMRFEVTSSRIRAKANALNKKGVTVGIRIGGNGLWIFSEDDAKLLAPQKPGRPRKNRAE